MDSYNDVARFMKKAGEDTLRYRNFNDSKEAEQPSRWAIVNSVAQAADRPLASAEPAAADAGHAAPREENAPWPAIADTARLVDDTARLAEDTAELADHTARIADGASVSGFGHLFRQSAPRAAEQATGRGEASLKALLKRIGS